MSETTDEFPDDVWKYASMAVVHAPEYTDRLHRDVANAILAERERCAKIAEYGVQWTPAVKNQAIIDESCRLIASSIRSPDTIGDRSKI